VVQSGFASGAGPDYTRSMLERSFSRSTTADDGPLDRAGPRSARPGWTLSALRRAYVAGVWCGPSRGPLALLLAAALAQAHCGPLEGNARNDGGAVDAGHSSVQIQFVEQSPLQLEPGAFATLRVRVMDSEGRPVRTEVRFALLGESADATLLATRAPTEVAANGASMAQVSLRASNAPALFSVRASAGEGAVALRDVSVSDRGFGVIRVSIAYSGVRGTAGFALGLFADGRCEALRTARPDRTMRLSNARSGEAVFASLTADREYAVRVEGLGPGSEVVSVGCVEGVRVARDGERIVAVRPEDLPLHAQGAYEVRVQLGLDVVARAAAALWMEADAPGDEARALLRSVAEAVERSAGAAARGSFERVVEDRLASEVSAALRARDATPSRRLRLFADGLAASIGGARWIVEGVAANDDGANRLDVRRVRLLVDPQTPTEPGDDVSREAMPGGVGRIALLPGDRVGIVLDGVPLPVSELANLARDAHLARLGQRSTGERLRAEVRCDLIAPLVTPHATGCDGFCVTAACEERLEDWARRFDDAVSAATGTLRTARVAFVGVGLAPTGTVTLGAVASSAVEGSFIEDPSRPIRGAATLGRP
jgi:hypothetical protein